MLSIRSQIWRHLLISRYASYRFKCQAKFWSWIFEVNVQRQSEHLHTFLSTERTCSPKEDHDILARFWSFQDLSSGSDHTGRIGSHLPRSGVIIDIAETWKAMSSSLRFRTPLMSQNAVQCEGPPQTDHHSQYEGTAMVWLECKLTAPHAVTIVHWWLLVHSKQHLLSEALESPPASATRVTSDECLA